MPTPTPTDPKPGTENNDEPQDPKPDDFAAITSQADLDKVVQSRLARERTKYADYDDLKAKAAKLDEIEAANKSDLERANARAEAAEAKVAQYETRDQIKTWAEEIAKDSPVPASLLRGSTREELETHFEQLSAALNTTPNGTDPTLSGKPVLTIGQQPPQARTLSIDEQIKAAAEAGDKNLVASLKAMKLGASKTT